MYLDRWAIVKCPKCGKVEAFYLTSQAKQEFDSLNLMCPACRIKFELAGLESLSSKLVTKIMTEELKHRNIRCGIDTPKFLFDLLTTYQLAEPVKTAILKQFGRCLFDGVKPGEVL